MYIKLYIYIYIERERERETKRGMLPVLDESRFCIREVDFIARARRRTRSQTIVPKVREVDIFSARLRAHAII